jgi:hypothetical protein
VSNVIHVHYSISKGKPMPAMLRWNKKAKKIAESIMGKPENEDG